MRAYSGNALPPGTRSWLPHGVSLVPSALPRQRSHFIDRNPPDRKKDHNGHKLPETLPKIHVQGGRCGLWYSLERQVAYIGQWRLRPLVSWSCLVCRGRQQNGAFDPTRPSLITSACAAAAKTCGFGGWSSRSMSWGESYRRANEPIDGQPRSLPVWGNGHHRLDRTAAYGPWAHLSS